MCFRIIARSLFLSISLSLSNAQDVAFLLISSGKSLLRIFMPIPTTIKSTLSNSQFISVRIPTSFLLPIITSLGHLISAPKSKYWLSAFATASPQSGVIAETSIGAISGLNSTEKLIVSSFLLCHTLPSLPLPPVCSLEAITVPVGYFSALDFR